MSIDEPLREIVKLADDLAHASAIYGDENAIACRIGDLAREALRALSSPLSPSSPPHDSR